MRAMLFFFVGLAACVPGNETRVIDGANLYLDGSRLSLHQIEAPKLKGACEAESAAAEAARARLESLITGAKEITSLKTGMACLSFQTCDALVKVDGKDVGDILLAEGLVASSYYRGLDAPPYDWCVTPREPLPTPSRPAEQH
jgi:endonuclease YncB( thermonuclease family)